VLCALAGPDIVTGSVARTADDVSVTAASVVVEQRHLPTFNVSSSSSSSPAEHSSKWLARNINQT